ncbi:MAG: pyrroline-5-carboxylate reductase [Desulfobacteraceae bacterium]|nr:pyrroline-5-carboxylate reductase [Desulfobacteraceae bacterium]
MKTIGFIGGGQMAEALIKGLLSNGLFNADQIYFKEPHQDRNSYMSDTYGISALLDAKELCSTSKILILAVKPQVMSQVVTELRNHLTKDHLIVTIAAGLPIAFYEQLLDKDYYKIVRVMPNTPALVLEAASALCYNKNVLPEEIQLAKNLFNSVGQTVTLEETHLDAVTGLSGSGPAYVFSFIEALIDAGIKVGLSREAAVTLTLQTISGSIALMQEKGQHPAILRSQVTSPGGTTISGLHVLEKNGFQGIIMDAIEAATNRSKELGNG